MLHCFGLPQTSWYAAQVLQQDLFCRVGRGLYTLRAFPGVVPYVEPAKPDKGEVGQTCSTPVYALPAVHLYISATVYAIVCSVLSSCSYHCQDMVSFR